MKSPNDFMLTAAHTEAQYQALAAELAGCKQQLALAPTYEKMIAHHGIQEARIRDLEAELAHPDYLECCAVRRAAEKRCKDLEAALTLLTNGFKYSTEVVTIAREALGQKP